MGDAVSDAAAVAVAIAAWLGALAALPVPRWIGVVLVAAALVGRRPVALVVGAGVLASGLAAASWAGLAPPSVPTSVRAPAVLATDPVELRSSVRVDLRVGGRRVEAWASGAAADALRDRLAGEVVIVRGRLRAPPPEARDRLAIRHVAARLDISSVEGGQPGAPLARATNAVRRVLERGARSLSEPREALLLGFLLGDDRAIAATVEADFRAAGLSHLLAVSGSNLAFLFAVVTPFLRRFELRGRLVASLLVIGFFAVLTRAEPSVLRASAMAALACWSVFIGRPVSRLRIVALAVALLVAIDPVLVHSVGFQLSVGACVGLTTLAAPLARRLPGPRWLAEPLAVTLAAQLGVAPVLLATFDGMPAVTVVANLLAVPVAAPLTGWGMTAGLLAGVLGGPFAAVLHVPTSAMVGWIASVARVCARLPLGTIGGAEAVLLAACIVAWALVRRRAVLVAGAALVVTALVAAPAPGLAAADIAPGAQLWRHGGTVLVLEGDVDAGLLLDGLRRAQVRAVDLVVARRGNRTVAGVVLDLRSRLQVRAIAAPPQHRIRGATAVGTPTIVQVGHLVVRLRPRGAVLDVDIGETADDAGAPRGRDP